MRVLIHGFGSFPVVFWHMLDLALREHPEIAWAILLNSDHHEKKFRNLLGPDAVRIVRLRRSPEREISDDSMVYPGELFKDIEAQKRSFKHLPAETQVRFANAMYAEMLAFAKRFSPTHALVSQVEGFDGKAFIAAARSVGAEVVVPTGCRNLGGTFFSPDDSESLPPYASPDVQGCMEEAREFIERFRKTPSPAWHPPANALHGDQLPGFVEKTPLRALRAVKRWWKHPASIEWSHWRTSILNNLPRVRDGIWKARKAKNEKLCDIRSLSQLPPKFIYYPLQYSPESSINTPAPYFVDQLRAIDAIRFAMPSDWRLVVKEHPACIIVRPSEIVKSIRRKAGVLVAHVSMPGVELIQKSELVISVTGTATLEALLFGKPALTLGQSLATPFLGGRSDIEGLKERILASHRIGISDYQVQRAVATLMSVRRKFVFASPGLPGEPVLRGDNVAYFLRSFLEHCAKSATGGNTEKPNPVQESNALPD